VGQSTTDDSFQRSLGEHSAINHFQQASTNGPTANLKTPILFDTAKTFILNKNTLFWRRAGGGLGWGRNLDYTALSADRRLTEGFMDRVCLGHKAASSEAESGKYTAITQLP
jgi:hypothetical protein